MNKIKELREEKGWKQEDLGNLLGVQKATVSKYETGRIPLTDDTIRKLSDIFQVPSDYILGISSSKDKLNDKTMEETIYEKYGLKPENIEELKKYAELLKLKQLADEDSEFGSNLKSLRHNNK